MKYNKRRAYDSSEDDFIKEMRNIGKESKGDKPLAEELIKMYVGKQKRPIGRTRRADAIDDRIYDPEDVADPPINALNMETYKEQLSLDSDKEEDDFFVNTDTDDEDRLKDIENMRTEYNYPAGRTPTAKTKALRAKQAARSKVAQTQARLVNSKNLATLINKKGLIAKEEIPGMVKLIASIDNPSFVALHKIVARINTQPMGRVAKASAKTGEASLSIPLHVAKPNRQGQSLIDALQDAPWEGAPPKGYSHSDVINSLTKKR